MANFYDINSVADMFSVTRATIYNMIVANKIKAIRFGRKWLITEEEINRIINEGVDYDELHRNT